MSPAHFPIEITNSSGHCWCCRWSPKRFPHSFQHFCPSYVNNCRRLLWHMQALLLILVHVITQLLCFPWVDSETSVLQYFLSYDPVRDGVLCWAFVYHGWLLCHVTRQPKICNHVFLVWFWNALNRAWYTHVWWPTYAEIQVWRVGLEGTFRDHVPQVKISQVSLSAMTVGKLWLTALGKNRWTCAECLIYVMSLYDFMIWALSIWGITIRALWSSMCSWAFSSAQLWLIFSVL